MQSWAGIESGAEPSAGSPASTNQTAAREHPAPHQLSTARLRRAPRPIVGSIDGAGAMVQRNAREVVVGSALVVLPGIALTLIATSLTFDRYQTLKGSVVSVPELIGGQRAATGVEELLVYVGLLLTSLAACLVGGYVSTLAARRQLGQNLSIRAGYRAMLPRLGALVGAWLLGHWWIPLAALALANARGSGWAAVLFLGVPATLALTTLTVVASPAIVVERLGPIAGLKRSYRIARRHFATMFGFTAAAAAVGLFFQYGIAYLPRLLQAIGLVNFGRFGWLIEGVAGQVGRLISIPLVASATALMYLQMRMTTEGMDLLVDARLAFGSAPGTPA